MEYTKLTMGSYNLHIIKTNKFKTITVDVNFRRPIVKEEITKRNLLKEILLNSTKKYNTKRKLVLETENLYDIKILLDVTFGTSEAICTCFLGCTNWFSGILFILLTSPDTSKFS